MSETICNKRLLFITTRLFYPTDSGRKLSLYHYCSGLHQVYGYDIFQYSFLEHGQTAEDVDKQPEFIKEIIIAENISLATKLLNILKYSLFGKKLPFQCSLFLSKGNVNSIKETIGRIKPDVIIVDMIRLAQYYDCFKDFQCTKILDLDDLLSKRYERQVNSIGQNADFLGTYSGNLPSFVSKALQSFKNAILKGETTRLKRYEIEYARRYDSTVFVSQAETDCLNKELGEEKAVTITTGVDSSYFEDLCADKIPNSLSFVGNLSYSASVDSLEMIISNVLPQIKANVTLYVLGKCPGELREKHQGNPKVVFKGFVEDLRIAVGETEVFLSPIAYGSGIKTKILEAMALGVPVVTNAVGAEGIAAESGVHFLVSDDFAEMAGYVDKLLLGEKTRDEIGMRGRELMREQYQWEYIMKGFAEILPQGECSSLGVES